MTVERLVLHESPIDAPTRRVVYQRRADGHIDRRTQLWRLSCERWWTTADVVLADVRLVERGSIA